MAELAGRKALVVEDDGSIAFLIEQMLEAMGCEIVASVAHLADAQKVAESAEIDFAVLDVNLDGRPVFPVARLLRDRSIPFIFSSGYGGGGLPAEFSGAPVLAKPFVQQSLQRAVGTLFPQP